MVRIQVCPPPCRISLALRERTKGRFSFETRNCKIAKNRMGKVPRWVADFTNLNCQSDSTPIILVFWESHPYVHLNCPSKYIYLKTKSFALCDASRGWWLHTLPKNVRRSSVLIQDVSSKARSTKILPPFLVLNIKVLSKQNLRCFRNRYTHRPCTRKKRGNLQKFSKTLILSPVLEHLMFELSISACLTLDGNQIVY